jgi:hypothetical protein
MRGTEIKSEIQAISRMFWVSCRFFVVRDGCHGAESVGHDCRGIGVLLQCAPDRRANDWLGVWPATAGRNAGRRRSMSLRAILCNTIAPLTNGRGASRPFPLWLGSSVVGDSSTLKRKG